MGMMLRIAIGVALSCALGFAAQAQQRPRQPPEKYSPKPVQPRQPPAAPAAPQSSTTPSQPEMRHSPWVKFCGHDTNDPAAKNVCLTVKEARLQTGQFLAGAALIDKGEQQLLRVTLPLGMQLMPGARMFIDGDA